MACLLSMLSFVGLVIHEPVDVLRGEIENDMESSRT